MAVVSNHRGHAPARNALLDFAPPAIPFDRRELLERVEGDHVLFLQLLRHFRSGLPRFVNALQVAVEARDAVQAEWHASMLEGALLSLSARPSALLARRVEDLTRRNDFAGAMQALLALEGALACLDVELRSELGGQQE